MSKALAFYADRDNYVRKMEDPQGSLFKRWTLAECDGGELARAAIREEAGIIDALKSLDRYDVGEETSDESPDGEWVSWHDVQHIIESFK